ncbi:MAG: beta-glucosidase [Promethearchaeota archaeon]
MGVLSNIDDDTAADSKAENLVKQLTLEEKFLLLANRDDNVYFSSTAIPRLGIPSMEMTDGPLGVSWHSSNMKCTRFPATIGLAATWDRSLSRRVGEALGRETKAAGKHLLLAPGVNIHRTPLNGRTFEYMSEDPFLTKEIAIPYVRGVQSQGVGACLKHFAANNQEANRRTSSSEIDERTLHEVYLRAFKEVIQQAEPWSIMGSYNKINGKYVYENVQLLRRTLMDDWGFKGFVVTDWDATKYMDDAAICINSGLSIEMPRPHCYKLQSLKSALKNQEFTEYRLDDVVKRFLRMFFLAGIMEPRTSSADSDAGSNGHHELARKIAEEGMVLLKNDRGLLPISLKRTQKLALLGPNLNVRLGRPQYGGSSAVVPPYEITPLEGITERCSGKVAIVSDTSKADVAIVFAGLNHDKGMDTESSDRESFSLPISQVKLIKETARENPDTVVVLISGSPVGMSEWIGDVPVVLEAWYPGMESGRAIANVLLGDVNPSGKLPITFPRRLMDSPAHSTKSNRTYPGDKQLRVYYEEGIMVGYRFFDAMNIEPQFPFGFGLSYTQFKYENFKVNKSGTEGMDDHLVASVDVTNTGSISGSEVIQLYARQSHSAVQRPPKELVGFEKTLLQPKETISVSIPISGRDLAYYDVKKHGWSGASGEIELLAGISSRCKFLTESIVCHE